MEGTNNKNLHCFGCAKRVKRSGPDDGKTPDHVAAWSGAIVHDIWAGYGSRHDSDAFTICICDDCAEKAVAGGVLKPWPGNPQD